MNDQPITNRPTWADINLTALRHNLNQVRRFIRADQRIMAVVKADAYGHGAIPVTKALQSAGVADFAVATLEEALELRYTGITSDILVLGGCYKGQEDIFLQQRLMPVIYDLATLKRLQAAATAAQKKIRIHLKIDTGMERAGLNPQQLQSMLNLLADSPGIILQGVMSHLACADEPDAESITNEQVTIFREALALIRSADLTPVDIHLCNSAGIAARLCPECTLVRPGIMLYGGLPGSHFAEVLDLKPVMHLRTHIALVRHIPPGQGISYGHTFCAERTMKVAVLPIGYADGYNRLLSNKGLGIIRGVKVPVVGRVCMDWIMVDVTAIPDVTVGDCVTLMGSADGLSLTGDDLAQQLGTISYEVFCRISKRVPRRFVDKE